MNKEKKCFSKQWEKDAAIDMWADIINRIARRDTRTVYLWKKEFIHKWNTVHNNEAQISWGNDCPLCEAFMGNCGKCPLKTCSNEGSLWKRVCNGKQNKALKAAYTILGYISAMPVDAVKRVVIFSKEMKHMFVNPAYCEEGDDCIRLFEGMQDECRKWMEEHEKFVSIMSAHYCDGKTIQSKCHDNNRWEDCKGEPAWFDECEYRVKPEMWTASIEENGTVHVMPACEWHKNYGRQLIEGTKEECKTYLRDNWSGAVCIEHEGQGQKESTKRRMTNRELARWLAGGCGECLQNTIAFAVWNYLAENKDKPVSDSIKIRGWNETEWHESTVEED